MSRVEIKFFQFSKTLVIVGNRHFWNLHVTYSFHLKISKVASFSTLITEKIHSIQKISTYMYVLYCIFVSDNGPHYHNSGVLCYLAEVNSVYNFTLKEYNYFEAGEGKSRLDSHFAHISHKIVRWVRLGDDLESGEQVADLNKVIVWIWVN